MGMMDDSAINAIGQAQDKAWIPVGVLKTRKDQPSKKALKKFLSLKGFDSSQYDIKLTPRGTEKSAVNIFEVSIMPKASSATGTSGVFGAPALLEVIMGRRQLTPHGGQNVNPDPTYNENDVFGVLDSRDQNVACGLSGGAGMYGSPARELISGYTGPTLKRERFPYSSGMGLTQKEADKQMREWQQTGISLGMDYLPAKKKFDAMLPGLLRSDPGTEFKMTLGPEVQVAKVQRRRMGIIWDTVVTVPTPTDDAIRAAADAYKRDHPDATLRVVRDRKRDYTILKRPKGGSAPPAPPPPPPKEEIPTTVSGLM